MRISKIGVAWIDIDNNQPVTPDAEGSDNSHLSPVQIQGKKGSRKVPNQPPRSFDRGHVPTRAIGSGKSSRSQ